MPMLSYKAGRAVRRSDDSNWVDPIPEKGTLQFELMDDLAQLNDVTVEKVASDTTGRTYVFKFSSSDQRLFYWFQDADSSKYDRFARNINVFLQNPDSFPGESIEPAPQPGLAAAAAASMSTDSSAPPLSTQNAIPVTPAPNPHAASGPETPRPNRVAQLMPGAGVEGSSSTPSATGTHQFSQEQLGALTQLLQRGAGDAGPQEDAHLSDILTASTITPLLRANPSLINRLIPHLPSDIPLSSPPTAEEIHELVSTPQWTEAVAAFDAALRTGGLAGVMGGLGLSERAGRGVGEFLEEVGKKAKEDQGGDRMEE
ncbi:hypothetical protein QFC20_006333 [Naganishia adeliensis]|uniref:Uncharacterized protein n=1 Tax=Naganishia adeliensis TaxID=92952 RepID=A0ACC2VBV2_9TREE|nr:hypothetical protein QFC20_006333 [Naganishia adeliensis]